VPSSWVIGFLTLSDCSGIGSKRVDNVKDSRKNEIAYAIFSAYTEGSPDYLDQTGPPYKSNRFVLGKFLPGKHSDRVDGHWIRMLLTSILFAVVAVRNMSSRKYFVVYESLGPFFSSKDVY
jgi:hypothetical protein